MDMDDIEECDAAEETMEEQLGLPPCPEEEEPEKRLQTLEDRQALIRELEEVLAQNPSADKSADKNTPAREDENEPQEESMPGRCKKSKDCFSDILAEVQRNPIFCPDQEVFATGCLPRLRALLEPLKRFINKVRIAEKILSGA